MKKTTRKLKEESFTIATKFLETLERFFSKNDFISTEKINKFIKRFLNK